MQWNFWQYNKPNIIFNYLGTDNKFNLNFRYTRAKNFFCCCFLLFSGTCGLGCCCCCVVGVVFAVVFDALVAVVLVVIVELLTVVVVGDTVVAFPPRIRGCWFCYSKKNQLGIELLTVKFHLLQLPCHFMKNSSYFFANYTNIFHKNEVQTVILKFLMILNLNWFKIYDKKRNYFCLWV